MYIRQIEKRLR